MPEFGPRSGRFAKLLRVRRRGMGLTLASALAAFAAMPACAQDRLLTLRAGASLASDSNVFRLPAGAPDPQTARGISGKSDQIKTTYVGLRLDKSYANQRFELDATETATRYDKFTSNNFDAFQYRGAWNGSIGQRVIGSLIADHSKSAINPADVTSTEHIVRTSDNRRLNFDVSLSGGWYLLAGIIDTREKTSQVFLAAPAGSSNGKQIGLRYTAASGSFASAIRRSTRGTNDISEINLGNLIDTGFNVDESELISTWILSGKSTLNGRITRLDRRNDHLSQRDFSGTSGELAYVWAPDARWLLNLTATRNIMPWTADLLSSYRIDEILSFAPTWKLSEKIGVRMRAYRLASDFRGPVVPTTGPSRRDVLRSIQLGMDWTPLRNATIGATVQRERRSSTDANFEFDDTSAFLTASFIF